MGSQLESEESVRSQARFPNKASDGTQLPPIDKEIDKKAGGSHKGCLGGEGGLHTHWQEEL